MGEVIVDVAAILGGLTIIGAAAWRWVMKPAFTTAVEDVVDAKTAAALAPVMAELSVNGGKSMKDVVIRLDQRVKDHIQFHERSA